MSAIQSKPLESILQTLVSGIEEVLRGNFLGAYLGGSFAHGGWDANSDVDFDIVIAQDIQPEHLEPLRVIHAKVFTMGHYYARHLEGAYFPVEILGNLDRTGEPLWYLDNGSLNFERSSHDNTLVNRWVLRECGVVLRGPDPKTLIPPILPDLLRDEIATTMRVWGQQILGGDYRLDNRWAQTFAVLSFCRMLHSLATGTVQPKLAGADWAKMVLDRKWQPLINDALSARPNQYHMVNQPADPELIQKTLAFIRDAIEKTPEIN